MEVTVLVPPNVQAGGEVVFDTPDGQSCSAIVPEGLVEGDTFTVTVTTEPPPAWLDGLLDQLVQDKFTAVLDTFVSEHCSKFLASGADGYSLECSAVHESYQRFFESRIEAYLRKAGVGQDELMEALCRAEAAGGPKHHALTTSLLTVQDFQQFATMMQQRAIESS